MNQRIIIAAGHGGGDPGAQGQGVNEANETVDITNRVVDILRRDAQLEVQHVPNELGLVDSINWVNARYKSINDGLAVEIHKNSGGGTGSEVWYPSGGDATSRNQAQLIANALAASTGQRNRGIKDASTSRFGKLGWTDDTNTYAVLVEAGFIDVDPVGGAANAKYADGIARGILAVWGKALRPVEPPKPTRPTWVPMDVPRKLRTVEPTFVVDLITGKTVGQAIPKDQDVSFDTKTTWNSVQYLRSTYSTTKGLDWGIELSKLIEVPTPPVVVPPVEPPVVEPPVVTPPVTTPVEPPAEPEVPIHPLDPTVDENAKNWLVRLFKWILEMLSKFTFKKG